MNWKPNDDDININVPPIRMGHTNPGANGWWLMGTTERRAYPMCRFAVSDHSSERPVGFTYSADEVLIFIIQGILPKQPDPEDHG